jgi:hypothetical protein
MKAYYLLAPLGVALAGCTVYSPVAYERVYTRPATVAVAPAYVAPSSTVVLGTGLIDSDGDGIANDIDRYPYDGRYR